MFMEPTPFELTPEQKGFLESLSRETGKPVPALIAKALDGLQEHVPPHPVNGEPTDGESASAAHPPQTRKPIWEQFAEAFQDVPDEEIERLPTDLAAQVDHYIYGLPKRPA
jgi:hypothetical protein